MQFHFVTRPSPFVRAVTLHANATGSSFNNIGRSGGGLELDSRAIRRGSSGAVYGTAYRLLLRFDFYSQLIMDSLWGSFERCKTTEQIVISSPVCSTSCETNNKVTKRKTIVRRGFTANCRSSFDISISRCAGEEEVQDSVVNHLTTDYTRRKRYSVALLSLLSSFGADERAETRSKRFRSAPAAAGQSNSRTSILIIYIIVHLNESVCLMCCISLMSTGHLGQLP